MASVLARGVNGTMGQERTTPAIEAEVFWGFFGRCRCQHPQITRGIAL